MKSIAQLRVVLVVSLPAMKRSMRTFLMFSMPSSPLKVESVLSEVLKNKHQLKVSGFPIRVTRVRDLLLIWCM